MVLLHRSSDRRYTQAMRFLLVLFSSFVIGCITDDGEIEEACDEIEDPCVWESDDAQDDTGT